MTIACKCRSFGVCSIATSILATLFLAGASLKQASAGETAVAISVEPKSARSQVDMKEFRDFISRDLSRPKSRGSLAQTGFETRMIRGRVVDHLGNPIVGAQVAIVERIGYSGYCYDENFDKTDELGRFLVVAEVDRMCLVVRRAAGVIWKQTLRLDELSVEMVWPEPATCTIAVDSKIGNGSNEISIQSARYWAGMSSLRRFAALDEYNKIVVSDLLPGAYLVAIKKTVQNEKRTAAAYVEVGKFSVNPGEKKVVKVRRSGKRRVSGKVVVPGNVAIVLNVVRQRSHYEDAYGIADVVACEADGSFTTDPLPPGRYQLRFQGPPPDQKQQRKMIGFRYNAQPLTITKRIVVPEADEPVAIDFTPKKNFSTAEYAHRTLDSQGPMNVSWSYTDVKVANLIRYKDRKGMAAESIRILNDDQSPHEWKNPVRRALAGMTDTDGVLDALLADLDRSVSSGRDLGIISAMTSVKHDVPRVVDALGKYRNSDNVFIRRGVLYPIGRFVDHDEVLRTKIIPWLIEALTDSDAKIRSDMAATLGRIEAEVALPALREARKDPNARIRVYAAWAIWRITGEADQAIKLMTIRLRGNSYAGKWESAYLLSQFNKLPPITVDALVAVTKYNVKPPYTTTDSYEKQRIKRSAIQTLKKLAPEALPAEAPPPTKT